MVSVLRNTADRDVQKVVFRQHIRLAVSLKLPLVIHCRDAEDDCFQIMLQELGRGHKLRVHRHCFSGSMEWATRWITAFPELKFGLNPNITKRSPIMLRRLPLDKILIETDAPYFVPDFMRVRRKWCHPGLGIIVAAEIFDAQQPDFPRRTFPDLLSTIRKNTHAVYSI